MGKGKRIREHRAQKQGQERESQPFPGPHQLDGEVLERLVRMGIAKPDGPGHLTVNAEMAWRIYPWLWFPGSITPEETSVYEKLKTSPPLVIYLTSIYQVSVFAIHRSGSWPAMWHLSIKRKDKAPLDENRWRILQQIKNDLVGAENEAVELYPAESRLVDTANQIHLFVLRDSTIRFPFGFQTRLVSGVSSHGAVQRPFDRDVGPTDDALIAERMDEILPPMMREDG
jgi:hypothetical protein